jgi:hypothetical protein
MLVSIQTDDLCGCQNPDYFVPLRAYFKKQDTLRGLYQGFKKRDISHITCFSKCRPITAYYKQCVKAYSSLHTRFLSKLALEILASGRQHETVAASEMFE